MMSMSHVLLLCSAAALASGAGLGAHQMVQEDMFQELMALEKEDPRLNEIGSGGQTPLMMAVLSGKDEAVKILLGLGADTSIPEKDGYTPCHGAGFQGRADIMKMLLAHGLPCTTDRHKDGYTPLHRVRGFSRTLKMLARLSRSEDVLAAATLSVVTLESC